MESIKLNSNVTDHRIPEKQEDMSTLQYQERTQGTRDIRQESATIQTSRQIASASNTSRCMIVNHTITGSTTEATIKGGPGKTLHVPGAGDYTNAARGTQSFAAKVYGAFIKLQQENWHESNALHLCLIISRGICRLMSRPYNKYEQKQRFLREQIGPHYSSMMAPALKQLIDKATAGSSWEYVATLKDFAETFQYMAGPLHQMRENHHMLEQARVAFIESELKYLEHIKDSPKPSSVEYASEIIEAMLSLKSSVSHDVTTSKRTIADLKGKYAFLLGIIKTKMNDQNTGGQRERLDELEKNMLLEDTDMLARRKYHDELRGLILQVYKKGLERSITNHQRIAIIETLTSFWDRHANSISAFQPLHAELRVLLITITSSTLAIIRKGAGDVDRMKAESMELIYRLICDQRLNQKCDRLYKYCLKPQSVMKKGADQATLQSLPLPDMRTPAARWLSPQPIPLAGPAATDQSSIETSLNPIPTLQPVVPAHREVLTGNQPPASVMVPHLSAPSHVQPRFHQLSICEPVQSWWQVPQQPSLLQATVSSESEPEPPFSSDAQQMAGHPDPLTGQPSLIDNEPLPGPVQDKEDHHQSRMIVNLKFAISRITRIPEDPKDARHPGASTIICDTLPDKITFRFAEDSTLAPGLHQYRPVDYDTTKMDNSQMISGQECLLYATEQYLQRKHRGLYNAAPDIHLPTNCGSEQFLVFVKGTRTLTNWLIQVNNDLTGMDINEETVYTVLMKLGSDGGKSAIHELFAHFVKHQGNLGNFDVMSNLFILRNYLLFIHSLLELKSDDRPTHRPDKGKSNATHAAQ